MGKGVERSVDLWRFWTICEKNGNEDYLGLLKYTWSGMRIDSRNSIEQYAGTL